MLVNEIAQWVVLLLLAVFVLGLTRQLGEFLTSPRERLAHRRGPRLGKALPPGLLSEEDRRRLVALMEERESETAALLLVSEQCDRCGSLLEALRARGQRTGPPVVAISSGSSPGHVELLGAGSDLVVLVGEDALEDADLTVKPFTIVVDRSLKVRHKQVTWELNEVLPGEAAGNGHAPDTGPGPADALHVALHEGRRSA